MIPINRRPRAAVPAIFFPSRNGSAALSRRGAVGWLGGTGLAVALGAGGGDGTARGASANEWRIGRQ